MHDRLSLVARTALHFNFGQDLEHAQSLYTKLLAPSFIASIVTCVLNVTCQPPSYSSSQLTTPKLFCFLCKVYLELLGHFAFRFSNNGTN
jgi:hypothetical protein